MQSRGAQFKLSIETFKPNKGHWSEMGPRGPWPLWMNCRVPQLITRSINLAFMEEEQEDIHFSKKSRESPFGSFAICHWRAESHEKSMAFHI